MPSALSQRALAYQETKNNEAALADLNTLLASYPKAEEREAALQQKGAASLGEQGGRQNGGQLQATAEGISEESGGRAGQLLHRQERVRSEGLQGGDSATRERAQTQPGSILHRGHGADRLGLFLPEESALP